MHSTDPAGVLAAVGSRIGASLELQRTLEEIAQAVVDRLGFGVAVLNLVTADGDLEVASFAGPDEVRAELQGQRHAKDSWERLLAMSEPRGRLRFLDGRKDDDVETDLFFWVPDLAVPADEESWHPLDALFAPLHSADGRMIGVLSVDLPSDGKRPDAADCLMLEVFAVQAALAIDHARLYGELQASVDEQHRVEGELRHRALHDPLTGLPNRVLVLDRLEQALARARRSDRALAVLFLDVDHFKLVNDSLGHSVGDELLVAVAQALSAQLRETDTAGRLGGDEFVLVLEDLTGPAEAITVAERLLVAARAPVVVAGQEVRTSLSIGLALAGPTSTAPVLLAEADAALYRAKDGGRGRWEVFDAAMRQAALAQLAVRQDLAVAFEQGQFVLHYQPVVDLETGYVAGYEALLRWLHPERGLLAPAEFLDVLQDSDLDGPVADWVLQRACADAASWSEQGGVAPFVTVNVSPRQLSRPDLARRVGAVLERTGLAVDRLWVEITEDRPLDARQDVADVRRLRELGVHVALDDFGTGYAGLTYLQRLPADALKIDREFVSRLGDVVSRGIVAAVVDLARVLGIEVVAEGVETEAQLAVLRDLRVRFAQGYLLGRPAELPRRSPDLEPVRVAAVPEDLHAELRKLHAVLATATDVAQVAALAVQAARRVSGADGGALCCLRADTVHVVHSEGYPEEVVARWRSFALAGDLPLAVAMREGEPVWVEHQGMVEHVHVQIRRASSAAMAMGALPLLDGDRLVGGLGVSWSAAIVLEPTVRDHLVAVSAVVAARLADLLDGR